MLENITKNLKGLVGNDLMSVAGLKESQIDDVVEVSGEATKKTFADQLSPDKIGGVMNLFSSKSNNSSANSLQDKLTANIVSGVISKIGLPKQTADMVAGIVAPKIIELITKKNEETDEDDTSGIMGMFGGDGADDLLGGAVKKNMGKFF